MRERNHKDAIARQREGFVQIRPRDSVRWASALSRPLGEIAPSTQNVGSVNTFAPVVRRDLVKRDRYRLIVIAEDAGHLLRNGISKPAFLIVRLARP